MPPRSTGCRPRVRPTIKKDEELIKTAPTPPQAAAAIVKVINAKNPKLFNQVDFKSKVFLGINKLLPQGMKDAILLRTMDIRV